MASKTYAQHAIDGTLEDRYDSSERQDFTRAQVEEMRDALQAEIDDLKDRVEALETT